jgi:hypothetical protein
MADTGMTFLLPESLEMLRPSFLWAVKLIDALSVSEGWGSGFLGVNTLFDQVP